MKVNDFANLLIAVTFYLQHVQKLVFNVSVKNEKLKIIETGGQPLQRGNRLYTLESDV